MYISIIFRIFVVTNKVMKKNIKVNEEKLNEWITSSEEVKLPKKGNLITKETNPIMTIEDFDRIMNNL